MPTCVVLKLPDSSEEGVDGVGVGGVGRERVADLVAEGGAVFLEWEEGRKGLQKRDQAGSESAKGDLESAVAIANARMKTMMPSMQLARSLVHCGGGEEELCCTTRHECRCDENNKEMAVSHNYPDPLPKQRHIWKTTQRCPARVR